MELEEYNLLTWYEKNTACLHGMKFFFHGCCSEMRNFQLALMDNLQTDC